MGFTIYVAVGHFDANHLENVILGKATGQINPNSLICVYIYICDIAIKENRNKLKLIKKM